jgi:hypothetical protein
MLELSWMCVTRSRSPVVFCLPFPISPVEGATTHFLSLLCAPKTPQAFITPEIRIGEKLYEL